MFLSSDLSIGNGSIYYKYSSDDKINDNIFGNI